MGASTQNELPRHTRVSPDVTAVILAGGRGSRMGGIDKACAVAGDARLIDHVLSSLTSYPRIVVSSRQPQGLPIDVTVVAEDPPFAGPLAAIARGIAEVTTPYTFLTTVDAPLAAYLLPLLTAAIGDHSAAVIRSRQGFLEPLIALWKSADLAAALATTGTDGAARKLYASGTYVEVEGNGSERDYDTLEELAEF